MASAPSCVGTLERARQFERLLVSLDPGDLKAVEPQLRALTVPTLVVWGTGDENFDVSWAYWLRDTIPGVTRVVTLDGARLFFPEERAAELVAPLEQHWAQAAGI
jgi:pimeloyl-ACP methyl ester carboxylesterase